MLYVVRSTWEIITLHLVISGVFVLVFAMEKFARLVDLTFKYELGLERFVWLYLSVLPNISDLIIPVITLLAVYLVVLRKREQRETLAFSSIGRKPHYLVVTMLIAATLMVSLGLFVSGYLIELGKWTHAVNRIMATNALLEKPPPVGKFLTRGEQVLYLAETPRPNEYALRYFKLNNGEPEQLMYSDCARVQVRNRVMYSNTCSGELVSFPVAGPVASPVAEAVAEAAAGSNGEVGAGNASGDGITSCSNCLDFEAPNVFLVSMIQSSFALDMTRLIKLRDVSDVKEIRTIFDRLQQDNSEFVSLKEARKASRYIFLALTNLFAVALALVAAALTDRRTQFVALPLSIAIMSALMIIVRSDVIFQGQFVQPAWLFGLMIVVALAGVTSITIACTQLYQSLATPRLVRA